MNSVFGLETYFHLNQSPSNYLAWLYAIGMGPSKLLRLRSNTSRDFLKLSIHGGILPLKLLLDKSSVAREVMLQISGGISPISLFSM